MGVMAFYEAMYKNLLKVSDEVLDDLAIPSYHDQLTNSRTPEKLPSGGRSDGIGTRNYIVYSDGRPQR